MEKITPLAKILHCRRHWRHWQIPPLEIRFRNEDGYSDEDDDDSDDGGSR